MSQAEPFPNKPAQAQLSWLELTFEPNKEGGVDAGGLGYRWAEMRCGKGRGGREEV
jgi:hypothetical protein